MAHPCGQVLHCLEQETITILRILLTEHISNDVTNNLYYITVGDCRPIRKFSVGVLVYQMGCRCRKINWRGTNNWRKSSKTVLNNNSLYKRGKSKNYSSNNCYSKTTQAPVKVSMKYCTQQHIHVCASCNHICTLCT